MLRDADKLVLRASVGTLLAAHGAQLFGAFEGPGLEVFAKAAESMGLRPGRYWALAGALAEFGGGTLTALGLFSPLGPIGIVSAMSLATVKAHWGKPIWVTAGGAELPATYAAVAVALWISGPGRNSLDNLLGIEMPKWIPAVTALTAAGAVAYGYYSKPATVQQQATDDTQSGASPQQTAAAS
jgi:putative oxidoreductase